MAEGELSDWMAAQVPGFRGPLTLTRLSGGQSNPTWRVDAASGTYALRQKPVGKVLPSAHQVDREFRVMRALAGTDVPVPNALALCQDDAVMGSMFFVMDFVPGRVLFDPRLPGMTPAERRGIFDAMNGAIAAISRVDPGAVGLGDYGRAGGYIDRQIARWTKQYRASETQVIPEMEDLIAWLPAQAPRGPEEVRLVHGDFRLDNLILHPTEARVLAVVDWELSTLGCPYADFAYNVMAWRIPPGVFRGLHGHDLAAAGIPAEGAYIDQWCARTGRARPANFTFYICLAMFRIAAILQGVARRAQDGTATDPGRGAEMAAAVAPLARLAMQTARGRADER